MSTEKDPKEGEKKVMSERRKATLFKPGELANPNGRPKGVPNKITTQMREAMTNIWNNNVDKIQADLDALEPKDRLNFLKEMWPYFVPKLQLVRSEATVHHTGIEGLSDQRLTQFILTINATNDGEPGTD